jgi:hypothetical protein
MPEFTVIVTLTNVVRARGPNEARQRIAAELEKAIQEIAERDWQPEVEYYVERLER